MKRTRVAFSVIVAGLLVGGAAVYGMRDISPAVATPVSIPWEGGQLSGILYGPEKGTHPVQSPVLFLHGDRAEGHRHWLYQNIIGRLSRRGPVLAIDFQGYGHSPALPPYRSGFRLDFSPQVLAAVRFMGERGMPSREIRLVGHSFGAEQALRAAQAEMFASVVAVGAYRSDVHFSFPGAKQKHLNKIRRRLGLEIPEMAFDAAIPNLSPVDVSAVLLRKIPVTFIYGAREPHNLQFVADDFPDHQAVFFRYIRFADHMFGTEPPDGWVGILARLTRRLSIANLASVIAHSDL